MGALIVKSCLVGSGGHLLAFRASEAAYFCIVGEAFSVGDTVISVKGDFGGL